MVDWKWVYNQEKTKLECFITFVSNTLIKTEKETTQRIIAILWRKKTRNSGMKL